MNSKRKKTNQVEWLVPVALISLSFVPIAAGAARMVELGSGADVTAQNARFFASPLPVVLHILSASVFAILGAFQFVPSFRHRKPRWHRAAGRLLVVCGLTTALSGLWMTQFYPWPDGDGELLYGLRLVFGAAMLMSIVLSIAAIRRRDFRVHGEWMIRSYAIGLAAGTQVLTHLPWLLLFGPPNEFTRALLMGAGWVINLMAAEWIIRKQRAGRRARRRPTTPVSIQES